MSKNGIILTVLAVSLGAVYAYFFTDWFRREGMQIMYTTRPGRISTIGEPGDDPVYQVSFGFDRKYKLTSVKVVAAEDMATNKYPLALWHLTSDSNSVPTKSIDYGRPVKGMKPAVSRAHPEPLQPDVEYVLLLEAGKLSARTNFHTAKAAVARR